MQRIRTRSSLAIRHCEADIAPILRSHADKPKEVNLTIAERDRLLNKIVDTLRVVCDAKSARLTGLALDCLHVRAP